MNNIQASKTPSSTTKIIGKYDSVTSNQYYPLRDSGALQYVVADNSPLTVVLPDTYTLTANTTIQLPLSSSLRYPAKKTEVFDNLQHSLISLCKLCDDNCQVILDKKNRYAFKNEKLILQGNRSRSGDGLWDVPITRQNKSISLKSPTKSEATKQTPSPQYMNFILRKDKTVQGLVK